MLIYTKTRIPTAPILVITLIRLLTLVIVATAPASCAAHHLRRCGNRRDHVPNPGSDGQRRCQ
ncbi:MAG: hypothetical protein KAU52_08975 [Methanosarcinales archaeon]|nr:hypothetical protein [Methanosarcinales archaeon]